MLECITIILSSRLSNCRNITVRSHLSVAFTSQSHYLSHCDPDRHYWPRRPQQMRTRVLSKPTYRPSRRQVSARTYGCAAKKMSCTYVCMYTVCILYLYYMYIYMRPSSLFLCRYLLPVRKLTAMVKANKSDVHIIGSYDGVGALVHLIKEHPTAPYVALVFQLLAILVRTKSPACGIFLLPE